MSIVIRISQFAIGVLITTQDFTSLSKGDFLLVHNDLDLFLDERGHDESWANSIGSNTLLGILQSNHLGQTYHTEF